mgnify:CR=1 FL=1
MDHPVSLAFKAVSAALLMACFALPAGSADAVAQQLTGPRASEKIAAVLWTRRADRYTLQVVFPRSYRIMTSPTPQVTLWLLAGDGTVIPVSRARSLGAKTPRAADAPIEVAYSVPLASGERAVAAAIRVDDDFFIEALQPLHGQ